MTTGTLGLTLGVHSEDQKGEWQLARDSAFTQNLRTITELDTDFRASGATTEAVPAVSDLWQGTWYMRARALSRTGPPSNWTTTQSFVVSHPPTSSGHFPTAGAVVSPTVSFSWGFSDTSPPDHQTAFQIIVERVSDGLRILDTGKITGTSGAAQQHVATLSATYKNVDLRWKIRLWDRDDVVGNYSDWQFFQISDPPTVAVTTPAEGGVVTTPQPTFQHAFTASGGRPQAKRRYVVTRTADSVVVYDPGWENSSSTSHTPSTAILQHGLAYTVTVYVEDSGGLQATDTNAFTAGWVAPEAPATTLENFYETRGFVRLKWSASAEGGNFVAWRIYRREPDDEWELLGWITDPNIRVWEDWLAGSGITVEYAVVQVAMRFGAAVESAYVPRTATPTSSDYWIVYPDDPESNFRLYHVVSDRFDDEHEEESIPLIGRGRHKDYGDRLGYRGSLTLQVRDQPGEDARTQRIKLENLRRRAEDCYLRNPFGDVWLVSPGSVTFDREPGVGRRPFGSASITYEEVVE